MARAVAFDSYSPLVYNKRGRGIGGFREMEDGNFYGCCACIGSAGIAIIPLFSVLRFEDGFVFNSYSSGGIETKTPKGQNVSFVVDSNLITGKTKILVRCVENERFSICFRKPEWCKDFTLCADGEVEEKDGYILLTKDWTEQVISISMDVSLHKEECGEKTAFLYGNIVLALDSAKNLHDFEGELSFVEGRLVDCLEGELIRYQMTADDGKEYIFTDYASCGKDWETDSSKVSVWLNIK